MAIVTFLALINRCWGFVLPKVSNPRWVGVSSTKKSIDFTFNQMKDLERRLGTLEESAPDYLMDFYEPDLFSFSIKPGSASKISILSTCYSVRAILASDPTLFGDQVKLPNIMRDLLTSESLRDNDIFECSLVLLTTFEVDRYCSLVSTLDANAAAQVSKLISIVLSARPKRRFGAKQLFSDYLTYLCCTIYATLNDSIRQDESGKLMVGGFSPGLLPEGSASELSLALSRTGETGFNEMCRQMAYRSAGDSGCFDIMRLAYSLLSYLRSTASLQGTAGREQVTGEGPGVGTEALRMNKWLVKEALAIFFEEQEDNGLWDRGRKFSFVCSSKS